MVVEEVFCMSKLELRQELPADYVEVSKLVELTFRNEKSSDHGEHFLVDRLRNSTAFVPELSIVAEVEGNLVGHILFTKIKIKNEVESFASLALAPVSVKPGFQKKGIGGQLIRYGHKSAKALGFKSIVVLGHEAYYPKFGYILASKFNIRFPFAAPDKNCMVIELEKDNLVGVQGIVQYADEFSG
jgi:predicted N-acetyltransferase YhbS